MCNERLPAAVGLSPRQVRLPSAVSEEHAAQSAERRCKALARHRPVLAEQHAAREHCDDSGRGERGGDISEARQVAHAARRRAVGEDVVPVRVVGGERRVLLEFGVRAEALARREVRGGAERHAVARPEDEKFRRLVWDIAVRDAPVQLLLPVQMAVQRVGDSGCHPAIGDHDYLKRELRRK